MFFYPSCHSFGLSFRCGVIGLAILLNGLNVFSGKAFGDDSKVRIDSAWSPFLSNLNQVIIPQAGLVMPFTQGLEQDLLVLNKQEMSAINRELQPRRDQNLGKKLPREEVNQFFHDQINHLNEKAFSQLREAAESHRSLKKDYRDLAALIQEQVRTNAVASLENYQRYDSTGQVGFCFGRALLIHHLLRKAGVAQVDMAKIFVIGQLMVAKQLWQFHVAVMVRDSAAGFIVIDPLQPKPLPYLDWIAATSQYDIKGRLSRARFYVTEPRKFLPSFGSYALPQLEDPILKKYFDDLALSLQPKAKK